MLVTTGVVAVTIVPSNRVTEVGVEQALTGYTASNADNSRAPVVGSKLKRLWMGR